MKNHVRPAVHRVLLSNQKPKTIVAPAKSLNAAGTSQGQIVGRGVAQHQAVEDFAFSGVGGDKWETGADGFVAFGRRRVFA